MPRTKGSKNKNTNTAKNKNVININVNSSKSKRGRPRKQNRQTNQPPGYNPGPAMMAPPQVIISQPTPQQDNSLLSSYIASKILSESNTPNRAGIPSSEPAPIPSSDLAPPRTIEPDKPVITTPAPAPPPSIKPSTIIRTDEPKPPPPPPKIDVKPDDVAPPTQRAPKFIKKLKDSASTIADAASSEMGTAIIESAINEIDKTHVTSSLVGAALRAHRNRKKNAMETDDEIQKNEIEKLRELHKNKNRTDMENSLYDTLKTKFTGVKPKPPSKDKEMSDAAIKIQSAIRNKKAIKTTAEKYLDKVREQKAGEKLKAATKSKLYTEEYKDFMGKRKAAEKILSAAQSKQYSNEFNQLMTVRKVLEPKIQQSLTRDKYIKARDKYLDKKDANKINTLEAQVGYIENVLKKVDDTQQQNKIKQQAKTTLSEAIKLRKARKEFKEAQDTFDPSKYQEKIRDKRKEFTRLITTGTVSQAQKDIAKKKFENTQHVFERKSNAGRRPIKST
jgi:hypothetical protein